MFVKVLRHEISRFSKIDEKLRIDESDVLASELSSEDPAWISRPSFSESKRGKRLQGKFVDVLLDKQ